MILGCTHYPLVRPIIQRMLGPEAAIVTSGAPLARQVEHVLGTRGLDSPRARRGRYGFLCTGEPAAFRAQGTRFLQLPLGEVEQVRLRRRASAAAVRGVTAPASAAAGARPTSCGR